MRLGFQDCVISPLLFNMMFNLLLDLLSPLTEERGYQLKATGKKIHDLAYADDLALVASSVSKAQMSGSHRSLPHMDQDYDC